MDWLNKFFKKSATPKVSLPPHWPLDAPAKPVRKALPQSLPAPKPTKGVINLSTPPPPPKRNVSRGKISTPEPAKKGEKTLNLTGRPDAYSRRSKSVIDMRNKPKGQ